MSLRTATMKLVVTSADHMDAQTFLKHLRRRHPAVLAGNIPAFSSEYVEECYRVYHDKVHELVLDLEHEHGAP